MHHKLSGVCVCVAEVGRDRLFMHLVVLLVEELLLVFVKHRFDYIPMSLHVP